MTREKTHASGSSDTVRQTIVETLGALRLRNVEIESFAKFKQKREIYKRRVEEKNKQDGVKMQLTTIRSIVDDNNLETMLHAEWVVADSIDQITEEQLEKYIEDQSRIELA